jgi:THO complex subunit 4
VSNVTVELINLTLTHFFRRKPRGGGPVRTKGARQPRPRPKKPKTAEELDKELDSFMNDDDSKPKPAGKEAEPAADVVQTGADGDVEMAA